MKNIAFVVDSLSNSDLSYSCIKMVNGLVNDNTISPIIFYQNLYPPAVKPMCLTMNINAVSAYTGTIVATDLYTADIINKNSSRTDKWLYLWNIDWLTQVINYENAIELLKNFNIIVRDHESKYVVKNYCGKDAIILPEFKWSELKECLKIKKNT